MEVRKLQTTAGGTFIITLPKEWVAKLGLKKGDLITTDPEGESLVITPTTSRRPGQTRAVDVDQLSEQKFLELSIIASYVQGHDVTKIFSSSDKMRPQHKQWVREAIEGLIGVETSEDYADRVVLMNLIDPAKFNLLETLKRLSETSNAVLTDALRALETGDTALAQDSYNRGAGSAKLYRLLMRLVFQAAQDKKLRSDMHLPDVSSVIVIAIATRELGRVAYHAMRIGKHVAELTERPDRNLISVIRRMASVTAEMQRLALDALLTKNPSSANAVFQKMPQVRQIYERGYTLPMKYSDENAYHLTLILRDIRAIGGYAVGLSDDAVLGIFG